MQKMVLAFGVCIPLSWGLGGGGTNGKDQDQVIKRNPKQYFEPHSVLPLS